MTDDGELRARVQAVLDGDVRPRLQAHLGDIAIQSVSSEGDVRLAFVQACAGCPARASTAFMGVRPFLEDVPGVRSVEFEGVWVSPHAERRMAAVASRGRARRARRV